MNYKELSRRCVEIEEEGMACGPVSMLCVASEAIVETEEGIKYLTVEWISEVPDSVTMIISSQSTIDLLEEGDLDKISQANEQSKIYSTMYGEYQDAEYLPVFRSLAKDLYQYMIDNDYLDEDDDPEDREWSWTKLFNDQKYTESNNKENDMENLKVLSSRCEKLEHEEFGIFWTAGAPEETVAEMKLQDGDETLYLTVEWNPEVPETLTFTESAEPLMDLLVDESQEALDTVISIRNSGKSWEVETKDDYTGKYTEQFKELARKIYEYEEESRIDLTEFEYLEDVYPWIQDWADYYIDLPSEDDEIEDEDEEDDEDDDENWFV